MKTIILTLAILTSLYSFSQTKDSVYNYLVQINVKYPEIVLKQAILETGHFTSYSCRVRKNLFGLTRNHKLESFDTWQKSCDRYIDWIQYKYKGGDYYDFLYELGYATDPNYIKKLDGIKI